MTQLTRRKAVSLATAAGVAATTTSASTPSASPAPANAINCGINYDVGTELSRGYLSRPFRHEEFYESELTTIRDELHADSVGIFGSDPDQLISALTIAADLDFDIRVQTRLNFISPGDMVDRLRMVAEEAERVRQSGIPIVLDVGCEYMMFADGPIEGDDFFDKMEQIASGQLDWDEVVSRLFRITNGLANTAREVFEGPITYSDTPMEPAFWEPFDIISIDHYLGEESESTYLNTLNSMAEHGKPLWVNEFGSTANAGAPEGGGMAWNIVDYEAVPPQILEGVVRDEEKQAINITDSLSLINQSPVERAYLYEFITTSSPRNDDPRFDMDLTGYGIVSVWDRGHDQPYERTGYWEPKQAFHAVAEWNRQ